MHLLKPLCEGLLQLLMLIPLVLLARRSYRQGHQKYTTAFCLVFLLSTILTISLNIQLFAGQTWNWVGKTASVLLALLFIGYTRTITKKEMGLTLHVTQPQSTFFIITVFLLLRLGLQIASSNFNIGWNTETFLYEASMPGLSEELIFRGILLGLLNRMYTPTWIFLKTRFGWGLIITAVLFGCTHGLFLNNSWLPHFSSQRFLMTAALGFVLGFVKEKSKSLVPSVVLHNCWNLIVYAGQ